MKAMTALDGAGILAPTIALMHPHTFLAGSPAVLSDAGILWRKFMPAQAMRLVGIPATDDRTAAKVFASCHGFKMIWIAAARVAAKMV
jgi:hypothetical protein